MLEGDGSVFKADSRDDWICERLESEESLANKIDLFHDSPGTSWLQPPPWTDMFKILDNDICRGDCPAEKVVLLVVDEAHRAIGRHAIVKSVEQLNHRCCFPTLC